MSGDTTLLRFMPSQWGERQIYLHFCFAPGETACRGSLPLLLCPSLLCHSFDQPSWPTFNSFFPKFENHSSGYKSRYEETWRIRRRLSTGLVFRNGLYYILVRCYKECTVTPHNKCPLRSFLAHYRKCCHTGARHAAWSSKASDFNSGVRFDVRPGTPLALINKFRVFPQSFWVMRGYT